MQICSLKFVLVRLLFVLVVVLLFCFVFLFCFFCLRFLGFRFSPFSRLSILFHSATAAASASDPLPSAMSDEPASALPTAAAAAGGSAVSSSDRQPADATSADCRFTLHNPNAPQLVVPITMAASQCTRRGGCERAGTAGCRRERTWQCSDLKQIRLPLCCADLCRCQRRAFSLSSTICSLTIHRIPQWMHSD